MLSRCSWGYPPTHTHTLTHRVRLPLQGSGPPDLPATASAANPSYPAKAAGVSGDSPEGRRGRGAGMRSLPHRAHLPCTAGAQPIRASGGCFLSPRGQCAPTAPSQPASQTPCRTASPHLPQLASPGAPGITGLSPNHWHPYTDRCMHARIYIHRPEAWLPAPRSYTDAHRSLPHQQACKWTELTPPHCSLTFGRGILAQPQSFFPEAPYSCPYMATSISLQTAILLSPLHHTNPHQATFAFRHHHQHLHAL